ncbi:hypothetical protein [Enemella sp. A6]|uniref:hypothetical protein n=1 Tax=Enemella sp. A6 TaxID=3440152 RepID=UPI003EB92C31
MGFSRFRWPVALMLGALVMPLVTACQLGSESLSRIVADLADEAGSEQVGRIWVERVPDEGLRVTAVFFKDDGTAVEYLKRPQERKPVSLGSSPVPRVLPPGVPVDQLDLDGLEQRLDEVPDCEDPRGSIFTFADHVAENVRCSYDGKPTGRLDGTPAPVFAAGDLPAAANRLHADAEMLSAEQVGRVSIVMTSSEVWTEFQVIEPALPASDGKSCALFVTRAGGSFFPQCEVVSTRFPADALNPEVIVKIWKAEGSPTEDWRLVLADDDEPTWLAERLKETTAYTLDGNRT